MELSDLTIKQGQIDSDTLDLQQDLDSGLFKENEAEFWKRSATIKDKIIDYWKSAYQITNDDGKGETN